MTDAEAADRLHDLLLPHVGLNVVVGAGAAYFGSLSHHVGLGAATAGRWDEARRLLLDAIAAHERAGAVTWLARSRLEYGAVLLALGDEQAAEEPLDEALAAATALGMRPTVERAGRLRP